MDLLSLHFYRKYDPKPSGMEEIEPFSRLRLVWNESLVVVINDDDDANVVDLFYFPIGFMFVPLDLPPSSQVRRVLANRLTFFLPNLLLLVGLCMQEPSARTLL